MEQLKDEARDLLREHESRREQAAQRIREFHPHFREASDGQIFEARLELSDEQWAIARERGFASWALLERRVEKPKPADDLSLPMHERIEDPPFREAVDLLDAGDGEKLREHLRKHPALTRQRVTFEGGNYFQTPALIEFVAENPVRRGKLPANIVEVARVILEAGAKDDLAAIDGALGLVCSGKIARECGVQIALIDLLCGYGADPDGAMRPALPHGEFEAVEALIRRGAKVDLAVAAGLGRIEDVRHLLGGAKPQERHQALAMAAQFGRTEIVRMLADAGEDLSRYNPVGMHGHSTPLHQAVAGGHLETVRLLVERGARLDIKDSMWQATPAGWAQYLGKTWIAEYLKERRN